MKGRKRALGFGDDGVVPPGTKVEFASIPQVPFRGRRLYIPKSIAQFFEIEDIRVGCNSLMISRDSLPGESFSQVIKGEEGRLFDFEIATPGCLIFITVRNISEKSRPFTATLFGDDNRY